MPLHSEAIISFLLDRGLLQPAEIVDGMVRVSDAGRRNLNFLVTRQDSPGFFVKQARFEDGRRTLANESSVYTSFAGLPHDHPFRDYVVSRCLFDDTEFVLVLSECQESRSLRQRQVETEVYDPGIATELGKALGYLHDLPQEIWARHQATPPEALSTIHRPRLKVFRDLSGANLTLIRIIQSIPEFTGFLDELRAHWSPSALTHSDLKWDNCLAAGNRSRTRLFLVDWELARAGDPAWDVGSVLAEHLSWWLMSIPATEDLDAEQLVELAHFPLEPMHPSVNAFWQAYAETRGLGGEAQQETLGRSSRYAGARLVQTSFEWFQDSLQLTPNAFCLLQVALNMMKWPMQGAVQLLGIPIPGTSSA